MNQRRPKPTDLQSAPFDQTQAFSHIWWDLQDSNLGRTDLQSIALPTELRSHSVHGRIRTCDLRTGRTALSSTELREQRWCTGWDSNPHVRKGHQFLRLARIPIPPPVHIGAGRRCRSPQLTLPTVFRTGAGAVRHHPAKMVRKVRFELTRPQGPQGLSLIRLPFRHMRRYGDPCGI